MQEEKAEMPEEEKDAEYLRLFDVKTELALRHRDGISALAEFTPHLAIPPLSAYLMARSVTRQERVIQRQEEILRAISASVKEQERLTVGVLAESKTVTKLTKCAVWLTAGVVALTAVVAVLTWVLVHRAG